MDKVWKESSKMNMLMVLVISVCLVFFSLTFYFYNEISTSRDEDANSRVQEVSEQYKSAIVNQINGDFSTLTNVALFITPDNLKNESLLLDYFSDIVQQNGFLKMSFTNMSGSAFVVDSNDNKYYNMDLSHKYYIQKALHGETSLSSSFKDELTGEYLNSYSVPVYNDGEVIGCLVAAHKSERFYNMITSSIFNGSGITNIVNSDGDFVIRLYDGQEKAKNLKESISDEAELKPLLESIQKEKSAVFDVTMNNEKYISVVVPLKINDWSVNTLVPMSYFHLGYERLKVVFSMASLILVILFIMLFLYVKKLMKDSRETMIKLAYYDSLTGMYNRNRYMDVVSELIEKENAYAFILLDISNFKFINETYGYENGNGLLRHVASVLKYHMHKQEVCFRDNADRFGMLLHYSKKDALKVRLDKITSDITNYSLDCNENYNIVCHCGIKIIDKKLKNGMDIDIIFDRASLALEKAKGNHVNTYIYFNEAMEEQAQKQSKNESDMRGALERQEFQMYLQPKVDIASGKVTGAEALVRWVVDGKILYYPDEFIPIFERDGFICELDLYMIEEACLFLQKKIQKGHKVLPISVNQSKVLLYRTNYLASLKQILQHYEIDSSLIIIEVTETVTMENMGAVKKVIDGLHELGFKVSMDDFGSGYSSLNVLQKLDIDELKLDRVFLQTSNHELKQKKVIESIVRLAKELKIATVSEGVENEIQLSYLKSIQCDTAQGFYYSQPLPCLEFIDHVHEDGKWKF